MNTSDHTGANPTGKSSDTVEKATEELSQASQAGADAAKDVAESRFEQGRDATTEELETASDAMSEAAAKMEENNSPFASYASELSDQLSSFSNKLSTSSIDDLVGGARSLARDNPAAFMLGSMAIGLAASRFFKATGEQAVRQSNTSAAHSSMSYDDHSSHISNARSTSDRDEMRTTTGRYDSYSGTESSRVQSAGTSGAGIVTPSVSNPAIDRGHTGSLGEDENVANQNDRMTREKV